MLTAAQTKNSFRKSEHHITEKCLERSIIMGQWVRPRKHSEFTIYSGLLFHPAVSAGKVFKNELHIYLWCKGQSQELMMGVGLQPRHPHTLETQERRAGTQLNKKPNRKWSKIWINDLCFPCLFLISCCIDEILFLVTLDAIDLLI